MQAFAGEIVYERAWSSQRVGDSKSEGKAMKNIANAHSFNAISRSARQYEQRLAGERAGGHEGWPRRSGNCDDPYSFAE